MHRLVERNDGNAKARLLDEVPLDRVDALGCRIRDLKPEDAFRVVVCGVVEIARNHEQLPELLFERHAREQIADPLVDGRLRILVRGRRRRRERHRTQQQQDRRA